jgi:hypothetical protein
MCPAVPTCRLPPPGERHASAGWMQRNAETCFQNHRALREDRSAASRVGPRTSSMVPVSWTSSRTRDDKPGNQNRCKIGIVRVTIKGRARHPNRTRRADRLFRADRRSCSPSRLGAGPDVDETRHLDEPARGRTARFPASMNCANEGRAGLERGVSSTLSRRAAIGKAGESLAGSACWSPDSCRRTQFEQRLELSGRPYAEMVHLGRGWRRNLFHGR